MHLPTDEELIDDWTEWESIHVKNPPPLNTVAQFVDHLEHVIRIAGIDHVGFGSDFNGGGFVAGCEDVSRLPFITAELVRRGHTEKDIRKFWGENTLRVLGTAPA
jgi:membrane dipeptidase